MATLHKNCLKIFSQKTDFGQNIFVFKKYQIVIRNSQSKKEINSLMNEAYDVLENCI